MWLRRCKYLVQIYLRKFVSNRSVVLPKSLLLFFLGTWLGKSVFCERKCDQTVSEMMCSDFFLEGVTANVERSFDDLSKDCSLRLLVSLAYPYISIPFVHNFRKSDGKNSKFCRAKSKKSSWVQHTPCSFLFSLGNMGFKIMYYPGKVKYSNAYYFYQACFKSNYQIRCVWTTSKHT